MSPRASASDAERDPTAISCKRRLPASLAFVSTSARNDRPAPSEKTTSTLPRETSSTQSSVGQPRGRSYTCQSWYRQKQAGRTPGIGRLAIQIRSAIPRRRVHELTAIRRPQSSGASAIGRQPAPDVRAEVEQPEVAPSETRVENHSHRFAIRGDPKVADRFRLDCEWSLFAIVVDRNERFEAVKHWARTRACQLPRPHLETPPRLRA